MKWSRLADRVAAFANPTPRHQLFGQKTIGNETSLQSGVIGFARSFVCTCKVLFRMERRSAINVQHEYQRAEKTQIWRGSVTFGMADVRSLSFSHFAWLLQILQNFWQCYDIPEAAFYIMVGRAKRESEGCELCRRTVKNVFFLNLYCGSASSLAGPDLEVVTRHSPPTGRGLRPSPQPDSTLGVGYHRYPGVNNFWARWTTVFFSEIRLRLGRVTIQKLSQCVLIRNSISNAGHYKFSVERSAP